MATPAGALEVLTVGRIGVDIYPQQPGPLKDVQTFVKHLGGTATNVAVGAARLGHNAAVLTKVGPDGFGDFTRDALNRFGVDSSFVGTADGLLTPVVFCALDPAEDPPLLFYRLPIAPDLMLESEDVPWGLVRDVPVLWLTGTGLSVDPSRSTHLRMLRERGRPIRGSSRHTVFDLDWRPMFWPSPEQARLHYEQVLSHVTVVVGNRAEVQVAVGSDDPEVAAGRLLDRGVQLALVKMGGQGVLVATPERTEVVQPHAVEIVCGLGAGDAFGAALVHGLLTGLEPLRTAKLANAAGALVAAQLACADSMPTLPELTSMVAAREAMA